MKSLATSEKRALPTRRWLLQGGFATAAACHALTSECETKRNGDPVTAQDYAALSQLIMELMWRIDHGQASRVHELFVSDGTLTVSPLHLRGSDALKRWGREYDAQPTGAHHVVTNLRFTHQTRDGVEATSTLLSFRSMSEDGNRTVPTVIGTDRDLLLRTRFGWRFRSRVWEPWLTASDPK